MVMSFDPLPLLIAAALALLFVAAYGWARRW
jgi:hypothetical protein